MEKQERAFQAWLNSRLSVAPSTGSGLESPALAARRMAAQVEGLLWQLYSQDQQLVAAMLKVEARIDAGRLRLRDEVSSRSTRPWRTCTDGYPGLLTSARLFELHWSRAPPLTHCMASLAAAGAHCLLPSSLRLPPGLPLPAWLMVPASQWCHCLLCRLCSCQMCSS